MATGGQTSDWAAQDHRRMLHASHRVADLDKTIEFYKAHLGMQVLREKKYPEDKVHMTWMGFGAEDKHFALELTYNETVSKYDMGEGFSHFAVKVADVHKTVDGIKKAGGTVIREPHKMKNKDMLEAMVADPTGYHFQLCECPNAAEPLGQVSLRVENLDKSIDCYTKCFGMKMLRREENSDDKYTLAFLGYGPEDSHAVMELTHNWEHKGSYSKGDAYIQVAIGTDDVDKTTQVLKDAGASILKEPGQLLGCKTMMVADPDGWQIAFVDNKDFMEQIKK